MLDPRQSSNPPTLSSLFGELDDQLVQETTSCRQEGIVGPVVGYVGALQGLKTAEYLLNPQGSKPEFIKFSLSKRRATCLALALDSIEEPTSTPSKVLDLKDKECPATYIYTKLALEQIPSKSKLTVIFSDQDSVENVAKSVQEEGHQIVNKKYEKELWHLDLLKN